MKQLDRFLSDAGGPVLVLHDAASAEAVATLADHEVHPLEGAIPERPRWAGVALVVAHRGALRDAVASLPRLGRTRAIACLLTGDDHPAHLSPRPDWPPVTRLVARTLPSGGALTLVHLQGAAPAYNVLRELARAAGSSRPGPGRIVVASAPGAPRRFELPPEILVVAGGDAPVAAFDPGVAPTPVVVTDPELARGPIDEGVLNPIGFHSDPDLGITTWDTGQAVTARTVAALRSHLGLRVDWTDATQELARTVTSLAMAGIPLVGAAPPPAARPWLGDALHEALTVDADVRDLLRREEHSIRLRRAALLTHSGAGWRSRVAERAGRRLPRFPSCSVVLATKRPHRLEDAVAQVARQRGVDAELVVAAHGFEPDIPGLRERLPGRAVEVVSCPVDTLFGDVLNAGVAASSGDVVVKMDDDDRYGPDFLLDLLLAREYSGADVVGTPAEFVYLQDLDRTLRRHGTYRDASERFASIVAGGTITVSREMLAAAGGFQPVHRFVDQQLFHAVRSVGGTIYRTHGLGYVLSRSAEGHTWSVSDEHFFEAGRLGTQWDGFVANQILEPADAETT